MTRQRLQVLFLLALLGVLAMVGVGVARLAGPVALAAYAPAVLLLLAWGAHRARTPAARPAGRTCDCCASTVHDPVQVR